MCRKSQGHACFSLPRGEGQYTTSLFLEGFDSGSESFWLSLSQFSNKIEVATRNRRLSGILGWGAEALESPIAGDQKGGILGGPDPKDFEGRGRNPNGLIGHWTNSEFSFYVLAILNQNSVS
jgi:hypothetical protein